MTQRAGAGAWWQAARPLAQANLAIPLVLGQVLAIAHGADFELWRCAIVHGFGILDHLFIVFANDVADEDADRLHTAPTPLSGGSRVLVQGRLAAPQLRAAATAMAIAMLGLTGWLGVADARPLAPWAAAAAIGLLLAYSFAPLRLSYRGFGELAQGLGVGAVLPAFAYYVQAGSLAGLQPAMLLPTVLLATAGNIVTALPDEPFDRAADKRAWPVRVGPVVARRHALLLTALGIFATPLVLGPEATTETLLDHELPALAVLAIAATLWRSGDPSHRRGCVRFAIATAAAANVAMISWCVALLR